MINKFNNGETDKGTKQRFPRLSVIRENPHLAALASKITPINGETDGQRENRLEQTRPSDYSLSMISSDIAQSTKDADLIFQLLPEMILVKQILISSILSPKDLVKTELNYNNTFSDIPSEITNGLIEIIRNHFDNVYKINRILPKILEDALFNTGSYPIAILPESSIDKVINSAGRATMESIADDFDHKGVIRPLGYLGSPKDKPDVVKYSLEEFFVKVPEAKGEQVTIKGKGKDDKEVDLGIEVFDNFQYLKLAELKRKITEDRAEDIITKKTIGMEGIYIDKDTDGLKIESSFYRRKPTNQEAIIRIEEVKISDRPTVGNPLTMKLPSESCIPVHVPGNPRDHLGYFIIMDEMGNPINDATSSDYYRQMGYNLYNNNSQVSSQLLGQTGMATNGVSPEMTKAKFLEAVTTYTNIVEKDLLTRLKNGIYGDNVEIHKASEIYRIMLARTLVNKRTQLLFIPKQLLVYFAFDFNDDGVGISLTEKSKVIASIRSILLFSNTMASIKNSIGRTQAAITLDPKDRDPVATVEYMLHEFARHRRSAFPFGVYNPTDLVSYLCNAGVEVAVSGNSGYPETKFEVNSSTNAVAKPDTDLEDSMKKRHIQSFGIAPETVDLSMGVDFATSIVSSNLLLSKRVLMYQEIFTELLEEFINKYTMNSGSLLTELKDLINNNVDKLKDKFPNVPPMDIIRQFMKTLKITLPAPDSVTLDNQMLAFDKYVEALDKALAAYFSTEFLDATVLGDMSNVIEPTKAALKAYFLRKWLAENNVLPELGEITMMSDDDEENFNLLNVMDAHVDGLTKSLKEYMDKIKARVDANATTSGTDQYGGGTDTFAATSEPTSPEMTPTAEPMAMDTKLDEEGPPIDEKPTTAKPEETKPPKEEEKPAETEVGKVPKAEPVKP